MSVEKKQRCGCARPALRMEGVMSRCMGSVAVASRGLVSLRTQLGADAGRLGELMERGDAKGVARVAHGLRGAAGSIGAGPLAEAAGEVEDVLRADPSADAGEQEAALLEEMRRCATAIDEILAALPNTGFVGCTKE